MGFRDKMNKTKQNIQDRHNKAQKEGERDYGSIFIKSKVTLPFWSPRIGENRVDIIPFFAGKQHPKVAEDVMHFMVRLFVYMGSATMNDKPYVSPHDNWEEPDPIKEYMVMKGRLETEEFKKVASKDRCVFLVWPHNTQEEEDKGLHVWESSYEWSYKKMQDRSEIPMGGGHIPFSDLEVGKSWYFKLEKKGKYTDARGTERDGREIISENFIDRASSIPDEIADQALPIQLDEWIYMHVPYEELYKAFHGKPYIEGGESEVQTTEGGEKEKHVSHENETRAPEEPPHVTETETEPPASQQTVDATAGEPKKRPAIRRKQTKPDEAAGASGSGAESAPESTGGTCPYGHEFGRDLEKKPDCKGCEAWGACNEEEDRLMREGSGEEAADNIANDGTQATEEPPKETPAAATKKKRPIIRKKK